MREVFKRGGWPRATDGRRRGRRVRPGVEPLEGKLLLNAAAPHPPEGRRAGPLSAHVTAGTAAAGSQELMTVLRHYRQDPSGLPTQFPSYMFRGAAVRIIVLGRGNYNALCNSLRGLGMQVTSASANPSLVEGYAPISSLPAIAALPQAASARALARNILEPLWLP